MPTAAPPLPPLPPPNIPPIDPMTGRWTVPWYEWMKQMEIVLRQVRSEIP